jgi:hypothetical protein
MQFLDQAIEKTGKSDVSLIDMGGTRGFWETNLQFLSEADRVRRIDIFNLAIPAVKNSVMDSIEIHEAPVDVTRLTDIDDGQYDIAFSNSVIEHVGNLSQQRCFADEIQRVAPRFVLQTPNRYFPLEPHFYVPFFPLIPLGIKTWMHRRFRLGWFAPEPDALQARIDCDEIRLLTRRELSLLFPKADLHMERFGGMVKSFIVTQ